MNILVLGGTRYFGKDLVQRLLRDKHHVTIASTGKTHVEFDHPFERVTVDRKDLKSMRDTFGERRWDVVYDQICYNDDEAKIATEVFAAKIKRMVFTSTKSVYGCPTVKSEEDFDPKIYLGNPNNESAYQEGKRRAEHVYTTQHAFPVAIVRIPIVQGLEDYTGRLVWHINRIKEGKEIYLPNPQAKMCFISASDAGNFLAHLATNPVEGPINACSPDPVILGDLITWIERATGKTMIAASEKTTENASPYGVEEDYTMKSIRPEANAFPFVTMNTWLPELISKLTKNI